MPGADGGNPNGHEVRSRLSTKLLLEAAGDLVAEGGYSSLTLAMVGQRAGYSSGLATARFRTKAKLLEALVDRIVDRWQITTLMPQVAGASGLEAFTVIVHSIREQYVRDPRSLRVLTALIFEALGSTTELNARFTALHRDLRAGIAGAVELGITDGSVRPDVDAALEAGLTVAVLRGVGYQWRLDPEDYDPAPTLDHFLAVTVERIRAK